MPRKVDPGQIRTGTGQQAKEPDNFELDNVNPVLPAIGDLEIPPQAEVDSLGGLGEGGTIGLAVHIDDPEGAHPASAISIDENPPLYLSTNVEGALDELSALIPPRPPAVGNFFEYLEISGIPDWGLLKLADGPLTFRDPLSFVSTANTPNEIYPYFWHPSHPAQINPPFDPDGTAFVDEGGNDPASDLTFNVVDGTYTGGGAGNTFSGAYTRSGDTAATQSLRITDYALAGQHVVVSGALFPADRGTLALIHWPADGNVVDFLAQPLEERCVAALLLGLGVNDFCDGDPGNIFALGETSGQYDPFAFPGQATGQYDLSELHTGLYSADLGAPLAGTPLPIAANNSAGQVRLGTDPSAGITPIANGLPILGATTAAIGGIGNDNNFFRYRMPYLEDNSVSGNGLRFTPTIQKPRWVKKPSISLNPGTDLTQYGDFADLPKDFWTFQLARYRHRFALNSVGAGLRESGSYILVHFKKEEYFENLVRDGIFPTDSQVYSMNLVDWSDPENITNVSSNASTTGSAPSYHVIRSKVSEDEEGLTTPTFTTNTFDFSAITDEVMYVSGVAYFLPLTTAGADSFTITDLDVSALDVWENTYRTSDDTTLELNTPNPGFLTLSPFSYSTENTGFIDVTGTLITSSSQIRRQRIEFILDDFGFSLASAPVPADPASYSLIGTITFAGDNLTPAFSRDAKMRHFFRRPVGHQSVATVVSPGQAIEYVGGASEKFLYHSSRYISGGGFDPKFGNFKDGAVALASTETEDKDTSEKFLDEIYRYRSDFSGVAAVSDRTLLTGPGVPFPLGVIEVPVRAGTTVVAGYDTSSWIQSDNHLTSLGTLTTEAQVAGVPDRDSPLSDGAISPIPSAGMLVYPQEDFETDHRPSLGDGDVTTVQPDYSALTGDRVYIRAFDIAFSRSGTPVVADAQPFCFLKIVGLQLADFAYSAPGPGSNAVSIMVKVPGLTTWLDVGRNDGSGPSKQDPILDGAGCKVLGVDTFDSVDTDTGLVSCQVRVNVGPSVNFFKSANNEVPILVKVIIKDTIDGRNLNFEQGGPSGTSQNIRGISTIEIVRPT